MLEKLKEYITKIEYLNSTIEVLNWDAMVNTPKKGKVYRGEMLGYLSGEYYKLITDNQVKEFIDYFNNQKSLDEMTKAMVRKIEKDYNEIKKIPEDMYKQYSIDASNSSAAWEEAKNANDFSIFKPHLKKMVDYKKKFIEYLGYEDNKYDTLLDMFEPGMTVKKLDEVFSEVRDAIVKLLKKIQMSKVDVRCEVFTKKFSKKDQEEFSEFVLSKMNYDFQDRGRIDESEHPFTTNFGKNDVRITTHYYENDFRSALFSCIHEAGHGIYEQNISDDLKGTGLAEGVSMGMHESQSRFYENIIGKSRGFWSYFYPEAQKRFHQFDGISLEEFYKSINKVEPSLVRTEADELTYSLHIIIRYELEKMLINDQLTVEELPEAWNNKYREYLGVEPKSDGDGVLQDMHWSDGSFGYFPSYALGNLYGAQMFNVMKKDIKELGTQLSQGNMDEIYNWLAEKVHKHGGVYKPEELIEKITGEELKAKYFIQYLNEKYSEIYNF